MRRVGPVLLERYVFHPTRALQGNPAHAGLPYEEVRFQAEDGTRLHGWFVPGRLAATWIHFHGNSGNMSHNLDIARLIHDRLGVSLFLFDYRGYGSSEQRAAAADRGRALQRRDGRRMFQAANEPKRLLCVPDGGHADCCIIGGREFIAAANRFVEEQDIETPESPDAASAGEESSRESEPSVAETSGGFRHVNREYGGL